MKLANDGVNEHAFPLVGLFLLMGLAAMAAGIVSTAGSAIEEHRMTEFILTTTGSGIALGILGTILSACSGFSRLAILGGGLASFITGAVVTCLLWLPAERFQNAVLTTALGCLLMLTAAILGRWKQFNK